MERLPLLLSRYIGIDNSHLKIFEADNLLPYEIMPVVKETLVNNDDILEDKNNEFSHASSFIIKGKQLSAMSVRGDDNKRKKADREKHEILVDGITGLKASSVNFAVRNKKELCEVLKEIIHFNLAVQNYVVFDNMGWFDPKKWDIGDKVYGNEQPKHLFEVPWV